MNYLQKHMLFLLLIGGQFSLYAQSSSIAKEVETHLRFLASDDLKGRATGEAGNNIAAAYIAAYLQGNQVQSVEGADGYFQEIPFTEFAPPASASLTWEETTWTHGKEMLLLQGDGTTIEGDAVFVGYGMVDEAKGIDDYKGLDVKGKIVVANLGEAGNDNPGEVLNLGEKKIAWAQERGAIAFVELYRLSTLPWKFIAPRLNRKRLNIADSDTEDTAEDLTFLWAEDKDAIFAKALKEKGTIPVRISGEATKQTYKGSRNVMGFVPGTDPELKKEFILVTAHYDHVGVGSSNGRITEEDSIFNGARDNAIGTVALMTTAKYMAENPGKRSLLFVAVTGEEKGMLGSGYYANHPMLPLKDMVFNLNCDGAGYNDKSILSVIGFKHVDVEGMIKESAEPFQLGVGGDVVPRQNLYDRSDNVSFAKKGIPAINVSPGIKAFDQELMTYYHQVADEAESLDFDYVSRFCQAFARIAQNLSNMDETPMWRSESKYAEKGKELYNK